MFGSAVRLEQERVSFTALEAALSGAGDNRSIVSVYRSLIPSVHYAIGVG